jgi:GntR family transcriptional repressor for pyruvate dehydrogenase complex
MSTAIDAMEAAIARADRGVDGDRAFHEAVVHAAHNPVLTGMLGSIAESAARIARASLGRQGQPPRSLATHRLIFEAIAIRDGDQARTLMLDHLAITGELTAPAR